MYELRKIADRYSYSAPISPEPMLNMTYPQVIDAMADIRGDHVYIRDMGSDTTLTFRQFKDRVDEVARSLIVLGVKKGDRVAMLGMNCADWVVIQFAAPSVGACFVSLNAAFPEEQLGLMIEHACPHVIISQRQYSRSNYFEMLSNLSDKAISEGKPHKNMYENMIMISVDKEVCPDGFMDWSSFIECGKKIGLDELQARKDEVDIDDINIICYTGGTSGILKGAMRTHLCCINSPYKSILAIGIDANSVICTNFLFFHTAAMNSATTLAMVAGAKLVIPSPSFNPSATLVAFYSEGCTHFSAIPTVLKELLDHKDFDASKLSLKTVTTGAAGCPTELMERVRNEMKVDLCVSYGGTEGGTLSMTVPSDSPEKQVSTVGRIGYFGEAKIIDPETGRCVIRGEPGEVCSRGVSVMKGYYNSPELTAKQLDPSGWYHHGDLGVMDEQGYLQIIGRIDDMIIRGGENVQPTDVESIIKKYPGIADVQVVGVPDLKYGHEIAAWIIVEDHVDEENLHAYCRANLAYYQIPRWFFYIEAFPKTGVGKLDRKKLETLAEERVRMSENI